MRHHFWCCGTPMRITQKPLCDWWHMFNAFVSTCAFVFHKIYEKYIMRRFDTGGLVPVSSLCGIVGSPPWFIKCLIGKTGNIWWVVYTNAKCMYYYKTRVYTILECVIVFNVCHVTSTWPFIYWWYIGANLGRTPHKEKNYWNTWR